MAAERRAPTEDGGEGTGRYRPGYELVAEQVLSYIADQGLRPGDRLPTEQGLAEILGATRNVTREAVKVLAAIGRLKVRRGAGIFVAESPGGLVDDQLAHFQPTSMEHVLMLLDYRTLIESETARRAATQANPIEVRAIREHADASLERGRAADTDAFARADADFHDAVGLAAHNVFLRASVGNVRRLAAQSDVLLFHGDVPGSLEVAGHQHIAIAQAIASGEPERAAELMADHIATTQHQFERKIRDRLFTLAGRPGGTDLPQQPAARARRTAPPRPAAAGQAAPPPPETSVS
ncbi:FadR/GntR family transcriptional regulator [Actinacidiphila guanduensis]|uniref:Transcriptional regulator, GntR family n=1 Tax=Actinacidiphila guanduensis TaxID=310781 RepID=A0A1H0MVU2_9ACTN|nr:FCD domain-containing protein [Actinacidiphila guanduensis]SDO84578.1 transcriptional regulator, GntR family [Actinacidiphila guanduensis]